jgi:hypothetical protein
MPSARGEAPLTIMTTFVRRVLGAALLSKRTYEDVEADRSATGQALAVVLLANAGGGVGSLGLGAQTAESVVAGIIGSLVGWIAWATLTYVIGTHLLAEPQTKADTGELLRTVGFAAAPGVLRIFAVIPVIGLAIYIVVWIWMLLAMVVAVRQALDYTSTARAVGVCVVGWALSFALAAIIGTLMAPVVT